MPSPLSYQGSVRGSFVTIRWSGLTIAFIQKPNLSRFVSSARLVDYYGQFCESQEFRVFVVFAS